LGQDNADAAMLANSRFSNHTAMSVKNRARSQKYKKIGQAIFAPIHRHEHGHEGGEGQLQGQGNPADAGCGPVLRGRVLGKASSVVFMALTIIKTAVGA